MTDADVDHFESLASQEHAAKLGMWVFLCSEIMLFSGLFALFSAYRAHDPSGFRAGVEHAAKALGSINTAVLLSSSTTLALAVHDLRAQKAGRALALVLATAALGVLFLAIKLAEYAGHLRAGIHPGGGGDYFCTHAASPVFWTLYYLMTGLHAVHVLVGIGLLAWAANQIRRRAIFAGHSHRLDIVALYWHLIDVIWIFLWPLFYLA